MPRTIVVTGASSGLGLAAAKIFAARGDRVAVVGRDPRRLGAAMAAIRTVATGPEPDEFRADFEVLDDVRRLGNELLTAYAKIDVLANNAGGMVAGYRRTADGFEATIQGNHLAPFLLTTLLRDALDGGRVVNTASDAHKRNDLDPDDLTGSAAGFHSWRAYGSGKAANVLFAAEADRRWPEILSVSFHPGVVRTNFGAGAATRLFYKVAAPFLVSPEKAGALLVRLADTPAAELTGGGYYEGHRLTPPTGKAADPAIAARLWESSTRAVGLGSDNS
jgi:NAD(P)-dependent dehydrogenase (short-subunit alcohol dehydrogenase family)